jgi:ATP-dependent DNA helicase RecQ
VTDILLGKDGERLQRHGHQRLSTFGLLAGTTVGTLRAWIDQLILQGLLATRESDGYPLVDLTDAGRALCKGEGQVRLSQPQAAPQRSSRRRDTPAKTRESMVSSDPALMDTLRRWRRLVAQSHGVPPYVVFPDSTLHALCDAQPGDAHELLTVSGIGERKAARYGRALLALVGGSSPEVAAALVDG